MVLTYMIKVNMLIVSMAHGNLEYEQQYNSAGVNLTDLRMDSEYLLEKYGHSIKIGGFIGALIGLTARIRGSSPDEARMRRRLQIELPADHTHGDTKAIMVTIGTAGKGLPAVAPRIEINVDEGIRRAAFQRWTGRYLPDARSLSVDRQGRGTVYYDGPFGNSVEDWIPITSDIAGRYRDVVRRVRVLYTEANAQI